MEKMQLRLDEMGLITYADCGDSHLICTNAREASDATLRILREEPENWITPETLQWVMDCRKAAQG